TRCRGPTRDRRPRHPGAARASRRPRPRRRGGGAARARAVGPGRRAAGPTGRWRVGCSWRSHRQNLRHARAPAEPSAGCADTRSRLAHEPCARTARPRPAGGPLGGRRAREPGVPGRRRASRAAPGPSPHGGPGDGAGGTGGGVMKRLVLCCDGTWNSPVNASVSNIEKIARSVRTGIGPDGVQQMVFSVEGVGAQGYLVDRLLGGAFGYGLTRNVVAGYRHLALNYEPGDEIYVFGFSRGAYTARSVVGMVATVGLLTQDALARDRLCDAERIYRLRDAQERAAQAAAFRAAHCHEHVPVAFLGVFDTVGALGVPGLSRRRSTFHDVRLSTDVECARSEEHTSELQ